MVGTQQQRTVLGVAGPASRGLRLPTELAAGFILAYVGATLAGVPSPLLSLVFNVPMALVLMGAWWALLRAPTEIRRLWLLLSLAATCWGIGTIGWTIQFEANGEHIPTPPTIWDIPFVCSLLLVLAAVVIAIRGSVVLRHAALDAVVVTAAGLALGTAFVVQVVGRDPSLRALATLNRPVLGVVTLVLIASAAAGSSEGIRRSTALLGLGQVFLVCGHLIYAAESIGGGPLHDRWPDAAWATGAVISLLAAVAVIQDNDPLIRFGPPISDSAHPRGSRIAIGLAFAGFLVAIGVGFWGAIGGQNVTSIAGIIAAGVCAAGLALRTGAAFRAADTAYLRLDRAIVDRERASDELALANRDLDASNRHLSEANMRLRLYQLTVREILSLVDSRSRGKLRALVNETTGVEFEDPELPGSDET